MIVVNTDLIVFFLTREEDKYVAIFDNLDVACLRPCAHARRTYTQAAFSHKLQRGVALLVVLLREH